MKPFLTTVLLGAFLMACATPPPVVVTSPTLACGLNPYAYFPKWEEDYQARSSGPITRASLTGDVLRGVLDAYNAVAPVTYIEADTAYAYMSQGDPDALLVFVRGGCTIHTGLIPLGVLMMWLRDMGSPPPPRSLEV